MLSTSSPSNETHRSDSARVMVLSHVWTSSFRISSWSVHEPSERRYCVPSFLKQENLPCKVEVTVEVTEVVADDEIVDEAVVVTVEVSGYVLTVDVAVDVSVVKSQFV